MNPMTNIEKNSTKHDAADIEAQNIDDSAAISPLKFEPRIIDEIPIDLGNKQPKAESNLNMASVTVSGAGCASCMTGNCESELFNGESKIIDEPAMRPESVISKASDDDDDKPNRRLDQRNTQEIGVKSEHFAGSNYPAETLQYSESKEYSSIEALDSCTESVPACPVAPTTVNCSICMEDFVVPYDGSTFMNCNAGKRFCPACIVSYITNAVDNGQLKSESHYFGLRCPCQSCGSFCYSYIIIGMPNVPAEIKVKIQSREQELSAARSHLARYCPYHDICPSHGSSVVLMSSVDQFRATCKHCDRSFCCKCQQPTHHPLNICSCLWNRGSVSVIAYRGGTNPAWNALTGQGDGGQGMKRCPNCDTFIEKNGGCPHMSCATCHYQFCWDCEGPYESGCKNKNRLCGLPHVFGAFWKSPAWGSNIISRFFTKAIGIPLGIGLALTAGSLFLAGVVVYWVVVMPASSAIEWIKEKKNQPALFD